MKPQLHQFKSADFQADHVCFVYNDNKILMHEQRLPTAAELNLSLDATEPVFKLQEGWAMSGHTFAKALPPKMAFRSLRDLFDVLPAPLVRDVALGAQFVNWSVTTKHCSCCGTSLHNSTKELAKFCNKCDKIFYPQVIPAVIVLVRRGREILLARGQARSYYSCIAGFVEAGENLEDAIRREVREEVGIEVRNIRYMSSQPWPFPNSLMIGYTADWVTGDITVNKSEIIDAGWFTKDNLPELVPVKASIARQMIEAALRN